MFVKSFLTGKRGEGRNSIEDSIALDISSRRFAVSDGVSKSFLPQVWSSILSQAWIAVDEVENFPQIDLCEQFVQERNRIMDILDEDTRMDYEFLEEKYHTGSATFCGVELCDGVLKWVVIGDSCLFLLPDGELPQCISSRPMPTDDTGHITPFFDNHPFQMLADGRVYGEWIRGERRFEKGSFLLMSDAMSAWFINTLNDEKDPLGQLMTLANDEAFERWVEEQCNLGLLGSDDESVIIVQIDGEGQEVEHIMESENTTPVLDDECSDGESSVITEEEKISESSNAVIEVQEQAEDVKKQQLCSKRNKLRIAALLRLCRMKIRTIKTIRNGSEL